MESSNRTAYLAHTGYEAQLTQEIGASHARFGRLMLVEGPARDLAWSANTWYEPRELRIESIRDGARALRDIQRNWVLYSFDHHRRAQLLQDQLPHVAAKPLEFPTPPPAGALGSWTMLDKNTLLAAPRCSSPFPNGEARFVEDRSAPPNRAYLKLWEAFTRLGLRPQAGELCLDLGSSPGGWTWVLQSLGAQVLSVDKAPLASSVAGLSGVEHREQSAFALDPATLGPVDWLFSDVACYPARLLTLVERWLAAGTCKNMLCTIKFQGATDHDVARAFAAIPGARLMHLFHNKHELTWVRLGQRDAAPSSGST